MDTTEAQQVNHPTDPLPPDIRILLTLRNAGFTSITDLSKATKIPRANLSRILRGYRYEEASKNLKAIATKLNITVDELLELMEQARVNPLYLFPPVEGDVSLASVDDLTVLIPNKSA